MKTKTPKIPNIANGSYVPSQIQRHLLSEGSDQNLNGLQHQNFPLSKLEYELLDYIRTERSPEWLEILNAFDPQKQINTVDTLLKNLLDKKLIQPTSWPSSPPHCRVKLTPHGLSVCLMYLESTEQANVNHEDDHRDKSQKRKINWKKIATVTAWIIALLSGIATILEFMMR